MVILPKLCTMHTERLRSFLTGGRAINNISGVAEAVVAGARSEPELETLEQKLDQLERKLCELLSENHEERQATPRKRPRADR